MSVAAPGRSANAGAIAVGIAQCVVLGLASLVVATWAFLELTKRLALSTGPLDSERMLFWSLVGAAHADVVRAPAARRLRIRPRSVQSGVRALGRDTAKCTNRGRRVLWRRVGAEGRRSPRKFVTERRG